jgi:hypothetical protein
MAEQMKLICPKCDNVIAFAPEAGLLEADLVCSNCGAQLRGSGPLEQTADKVKALLAKAGKKGD